MRAFLAARADGGTTSLEAAFAAAPEVDDLWAHDVDDLPALFSLFEATGWSWRDQGCEIPNGTARPAVIVCDAISVVPWVELPRNDPLVSTSISFELSDGRIDQVTVNYDLDALEQALTPWFDWLDQEHPGDVGEMYDMVDGRHVPRFDDTAIALFATRTAEFLGG